ncbi:Asp23/Gls24 family envelope stress response protein [Frigoribacterium sp. NPDC087798]|uniref:Asp23/Gls24 family envelope stress response protein n=1 Tax=Frigoribacterium sp. NPDC087798 TaxID=3363993 RepID=UPI0038153B3E
MSESTHHVTPIDIDAAASTRATSPEEVLEHTIGVTVLGVSGVHALGTASQRLAGALRTAIGTGSVPGVRAGTTDEGLVVDIAVVAEYPTNVTTLADTVRTQVKHAVGQLDGEEVTVNVTVTDVHGPFDSDEDAADKVNAAADKAKQTVSDAGDRAKEAGEKTKAAAGEARDRAATAAGDLSDKARTAAGDLSDKARELGDKAGEVAEQAKATAGEVGEKAAAEANDVADDARDVADQARDAAADALDSAADHGDATRASSGDARDADGADVTVTVDGGRVTVEVDSDSDAQVVVDGDDVATTEK